MLNNISNILVYHVFEKELQLFDWNCFFFFGRDFFSFLFIVVFFYAHCCIRTMYTIQIHFQIAISIQFLLCLFEFELNNVKMNLRTIATLNEMRRNEKNKIKNTDRISNL